MITEETLKVARLYFESYYLNFKTDDDTIRKSMELKKNHTMRVIENMKELTNNLLLNEKQKPLAEFIALFHDIGRFAQITQYGTFNDNKSTDHATLSIEIIESTPFWTDIEEYTQQIIKTAILNHSKIQLPKIEDEQTLLFSRMIRDADKLDVWAMVSKQFQEKTAEDMKIIMYNLPDHATVSEKILKAIHAEKLAPKEEMKTMNDFKLMLMSWVFDLNYQPSFNILNKNRYIEKIYNTLPKQDGTINAFRKIKLYIENKFVK